MKALRYGALAAVVAIAGFAHAQSATNQVGDREKLIGAWHLVHIDAPGPDGKPMAVPQPVGMLDLHTRWAHVGAAYVSQVSKCSIE